VIATFLSIVVVLPIAALLWESKKDGAHAFWQAVSSPETVAALELTFGAAFVVALINAVLGTVTAWVLVRDEFRGKSLVNAVIDLPFALPTIVAGLTLLALYGPGSPVGIDVAFTRTAIVLALCFVTLPFVIRTVQPVLLELDVEMEEAARSLGAGRLTVFRRIVLPNLLPGILSGFALALARALGEIGSIVVTSGNQAFHTEVASVLVYNLIQDGQSSQASAIAIVLLGAAFVLLLAVGAVRFYLTRHERA
jgi:sulfate transport system permease protein